MSERTIDIRAKVPSPIGTREKDEMIMAIKRFFWDRDVEFLSIEDDNSTYVEGRQTLMLPTDLGEVV